MAIEVTMSCSTCGNEETHRLVGEVWECLSCGTTDVGLDEAPAEEE